MTKKPRPPISTAIASSVANMVSADRPPSHHELTQLFGRVGLHSFDPGESVGKLKRARAVLAAAADKAPNRGSDLIASLLESLQAGGAFLPESPSFLGTDLLSNAQAAFRQHSWVLEADGRLRPLLLDAVDEAAWGPALATMVTRARTGDDDAALVTGTGKDLLEGAARHVLVEHGGTYDERIGFAGTLFQAYMAVGLKPLTPHELKELREIIDTDPQRQLEQALYLLAIAINALRNAEGTGHGRPFLPKVTREEAKAAVESMAVISGFLLSK